jgi:methenyltetrahydrofolate cyclohydrolase
MRTGAIILIVATPLGYYGHLPADTSLWNTTIGNLRDRVASSEPTPAGVSVAAISASLALALLEKVLRIVGHRKDFSGDPQRLAHLIIRARQASDVLATCAEEDIAAFDHFLASRRLPQDSARLRDERQRAIDAALYTAIEVPLKIARTAAAGLDLCAEAADLVHAFVAADLGSASELLSAAIRATLLSVDSNLDRLQPDTQFHRHVLAEKNALLQFAARIENRHAP